MGVSAASVCFGVLGGIAGYEYSLLTQQYQDQRGAEACLEKGNLYPIKSLPANCQRVESMLPKVDGQLDEIPKIGAAYTSVGREQDEWEAVKRMTVEGAIGGFALTVLTGAIVIIYSRDDHMLHVAQVYDASARESIMPGKRSEVALR